MTEWSSEYSYPWKIEDPFWKILVDIKARDLSPEAIPTELDSLLSFIDGVVLASPKQSEVVELVSDEVSLACPEENVTNSWPSSGSVKTVKKKKKKKRWI